MNEIKHIHLGRQQFTIGLEAYQQLRDYIAAIERQAGANRADVIEEVEARMAELLTERGNTPAKVILASDIDYLKEQLGEPRDFKDDALDADDDEPTTRGDETNRRLFRDPENGMLAGVAAGLATYLRIDVVIIRLLFIALIFAGGSGILLYLVLWLIVPEARTTSDRLQMRGQPVTVQSLKAIVDRADVPGAAQRANKTFGRVLILFVKVLLTMVGIGFVVFGIAMILGASTAATFGLVRGLQVGHITVFPFGAQQVAIMIASLLLTILSGIMLAVAGISLIKRRWMMPGWGLAAVLVAFVIAASVGGGFGAANAGTIRERYNSLHHSRTVAIQPFKMLNFVGNNTFYIDEPSEVASVEIRTLGKVDTSAIKVTEQDGTLTIDTTAFKPEHGCNIFCPYGNTNTEIVIHDPNAGGAPSSGTPGAEVMIDGNGNGGTGGDF